jgi:polyphosphate kinase
MIQQQQQDLLHQLLLDRSGPLLLLALSRQQLRRNPRRQMEASLRLREELARQRLLKHLLQVLQQQQQQYQLLERVMQCRTLQQQQRELCQMQHQQTQQQQQQQMQQHPNAPRPRHLTLIWLQ